MMMRVLVVWYVRISSPKNHHTSSKWAAGFISFRHARALEVGGAAAAEQRRVRVTVGTRALMREAGAPPLGAADKAHADLLEREAKTVLLVQVRCFQREERDNTSRVVLVVVVVGRGSGFVAPRFVGEFVDFPLARSCARSARTRTPTTRTTTRVRAS